MDAISLLICSIPHFFTVTKYVQSGTHYHMLKSRMSKRSDGCTNSAEFRISTSRASFSLLKNTDFIRQTFAHGLLDYYRSPNVSKRSVTVTVRAIHVTKPKTTWKVLLSSRSFNSVRGKSCTRAIFFRPLVPPGQFIVAWPPIKTCVKLTWICKWAFETMSYSVRFAHSHISFPNFMLAFNAKFPRAVVCLSKNDTI